MGFYDAFKDALNLAQKADNIELYRQLLDLSAQALDLQAENAKLKEENIELKKKKDDSARIIRHKEPVITLRDDDPVLYYCAHCYDSEQLMIQVHCDYEEGTFYCPHCRTNGDFESQPKQITDDSFSPYFSFDPYNR